VVAPLVYLAISSLPHIVCLLPGGGGQRGPREKVGGSPWGPRLAGPHTGWVHHIHSSFTASHAPRDQLSVMCVLGLPKACSPGDHAVVRSRCTTLASADKWTTRAASEEPDDLREAPHHEALDHVYMQCESSAWSHPPEWAHDHAALL